MAKKQSKTIKIILDDGDLSGITMLEDSAWNAGVLYSAPRETVEELLDSDACSRFGVYMLLSDEKVYVGQSSDLKKRIEQHLAGKDWWDRITVLTTKDDHFDHADIDYLEAALISRASKMHRLDCVHTALQVGKRQKKLAIEYLNSKNIAVDSDATYTLRQAGKDYFWANPRTHFLTEGWELILNDNVTCELVVLRMPANTFSLDTVSTRSDKPYYIDLKISCETFIDQSSGLDFSPHCVARVKYFRFDSVSLRIYCILPFSSTHPY